MVCICQEHRDQGGSGHIKKSKYKKSLRGMTRKEQAAKQEHKNRSRGKQRNSQPDKES